MTGNKVIISLLAALCLILLWDKFSAQHSVNPEAKTDLKNSRSDLNADLYSNPDSETLLSRIQGIEADLSHELLQRQQIERRLNKLEQLSPVSESAESTETVNEIIHTDQPSVQEDTSQQKPLTLKERLLSAGLAAQTIDAMQQTLDKNRLAMLQLRDTAIREGWDETQEFSEKMNELRDPGLSIREEFGEQMYDQYLYASGRSNRVVIREVYSGSAADLAGLEAGDIITSYASSRIYSMSALRQATVEGNAGEVVLLEVMRNDLPVSTSVPRGPLGISMNSTRVEP